MSDNFTTMNEATPNSVDAEVTPKRINRKLIQLKRLLEYAESRYHCEFSIKFKKKMVREIQDEKHRFCKIPDRKAVDALVKEWDVWKSYVSAESFSDFIGDGIKSIIEIEVSATFHAPSLKGYIGNKAIVTKKLPNVLATWVSANGTLCINGKRVQVAVS